MKSVSLADGIPANRLDGTFVPRVGDGIEVVRFTDELVLLDGWRIATVVGGVGALLWDCFDGVSSIDQIVSELTQTLVLDAAVVRGELMAFVERLGSLSVLEGVGPPDDVDHPILVETERPSRRIGDAIDDARVVGSDVVETSLRDVVAGDGNGHGAGGGVVVNWNPHCGYCASIVPVLAGCEAGLARRGVRLVFLASGSAEANHALCAAAGIEDAVVVRLADGEQHPFPGVGTPAAYHVDGDLCLVEEPVYGNVDVPALVARLAGVEMESLEGGSDGDVRYLLERGGRCAQLSGDALVDDWVTTRVYELGGFHVGLRCGTNATVAALDELFDNAIVDDPRAGHTFVVSLADEAHGGVAGSPMGPDAHARRGNPVNLLVQGPRAYVRSGSPGRVLRALLWHLHDGMVGFDARCGRLRVNATAALVDGSIVLLQPGLYNLAEALQPALAARGIALADVLYPEVDLERCEAVLVEPAVAYNRSALERWDRALDPAIELPPVEPGRYPLAGWGVMHPSEKAVTRFTPAQAAAATLSFVENTEDGAARIRELGELFERIEGFGLWYHSESGYMAALAEALRID